MVTLIEILKDKGISNPENKTDDVKRIVAESVDALLDFEPVVPSICIYNALKEEGLISKDLRAFIVDYRNPSNNPYFKAIPHLRYLKIREAIDLVLNGENVSINVRYHVEGQDYHNKIRGYYGNMHLYFRDEEKLSVFISDRLHRIDITSEYRFDLASILSMR